MRARSLVALVLVVVGAGLLAGCVLKRSKPAVTYVLDPLEPRSAAPSSGAPVAVVGVMTVTVPGWIDRPQITGRAASGAIVTDDFSRWGEPIARGMQRVVAENLAALLPDRLLLRAPFPPTPRIQQRLDVTIIEAARQPDGSMLIEARWAVLGPKGGEPLAQQRGSYRAQPTASGVAGGVAGTNEALAALSREVAATLRALPLPAPEASAAPATAP